MAKIPIPTGNVCGIYAITDHKGRKYVGSSVNVGVRWRQHVDQLRSGKHHSWKLQNAWNSYGEARFSFAVLEPIDDEVDLLVAEQRWMDRLKPWYNIAQVAARDVRSREGLTTYRLQKEIDRHNKYVSDVASCERLRLFRYALKHSPQWMEHLEYFGELYQRALEGRWPWRDGESGEADAPDSYFRWYAVGLLADSEWFPMVMDKARNAAFRAKPSFSQLVTDFSAQALFDEASLREIKKGNDVQYQSKAMWNRKV